MVTIQFNLSFQWKKYLQRSLTSKKEFERTKDVEHRDAVKLAFAAGMFQMFELFMRNRKLPPEDVYPALDRMAAQFNEFFTKHNNGEVNLQFEDGE